MFALVDCVCYNDDFINRGLLYPGSVPYIYCSFGQAEENCL